MVDYGGPQSEWMSIAGSSSGAIWTIYTSSCTWTCSPQSVGGPRAEETGVHRGVPDHIRSDNGKLRDELLQREAFNTLLEANGALRAVAAAHQHDPATQCLGLPAPEA